MGKSDSERHEQIKGTLKSEGKTRKQIKGIIPRDQIFKQKSYQQRRDHEINGIMRAEEGQETVGSKPGKWTVLAEL